MVVTGLRALGCEIGAFDPIHRIEDATSHYEWPAFVSLNQRLVVGEPRDALVREAQAMLRSFGGSAPIVLKEAKARLTLQFWSEQILDFGGRLRVILVLHRPEDKGMRYSVGASGWIESLHQILRPLKNGQMDLIIVPQDMLRVRPAEVIVQLAAALGIDGLANTKGDFDAWALAHPPVAAASNPDGTSQSDHVAQALFRALAPHQSVTTVTVDHARALVGDALGHRLG